ncbi:MAG: flagellar hook-associated protein FlgK, partial [Candidatus Brocadiaceae bacterium]
MSGFSTGVNAVRTAAQLIDMAGDNIANANTPGYHLKRADISPVIGPTIGGIRIGLGSRVDDIQRVRNELIERALLQHVQAKELFATEQETLEHLELLFGEPSDAGLDARLGEFFDSVEMLAADPDDTTLREQVLQKADAVCQMFNRLDTGVQQVLDDLWNKIDYTVGRINALSERIAALNGQIRDIETGGTTAASLKDTRDGLVSELAELINITTYEVGDGVVNVSCAGTVLVNENHYLTIEAEPTDEGVVIQAEGAVGHRMRVRQGQLGGLLELYNQIVPDYAARLDEL